MFDPSRLSWRDHFILSREIATPGDRSAFFAQVRRGVFVSLRRGVYLDAAEWAAMRASDRYRAKVQAEAAFARDEQVFSHQSAAVLWKLPNLSAWPNRVHVFGDVAAGGRSSVGLFRHSVGVPADVERIEGLCVSTLARTVVDLCRTVPFADAVVFADAALRRTQYPHLGLPATGLTRDVLLDELEPVPATRGTARARKAIEFADGAADRPGESISRVNMSLAGFTMPDLQAKLTGANGRIWTVDFWWEEFNLIGEFDGKSKYTDAEFLRGRTPAQAVYDEKIREDDLRAANHGMTRWPWEVATSLVRLRTHLAAAGVR